jgi:amino acid permease
MNGLTFLLQVARVLTWLLWAAFVAYCIYFVSNRAQYVDRFGRLEILTEAVMYGLPVLAVAMGFVQMMLKQRIGGSIDQPRR